MRAVLLLLMIFLLLLSPSTGSVSLPSLPSQILASRRSFVCYCYSCTPCRCCPCCSPASRASTPARMRAYSACNCERARCVHALKGTQKCIHVYRYGPRTCADLCTSRGVRVKVRTRTGTAYKDGWLHVHIPDRVQTIPEYRPCQT
jgi:hypothetical protein